MKFHALHDRLERLWRSADFKLENMYDLMFGHLCDYSASNEAEEKAFSYILKNSNLEDIADPLRLWKNYLTFKIGFADAHDRFSSRKIEKNLPAVLVNIILSENQLLLLEKHPSEIAKGYPPKTELSELEKNMKYFIAVHECNSALKIKDADAKISLFRAYLRNWRYLKIEEPYFMRGAAFALCGIIITSVRNKIPISETYVGETLGELEIVKNQAGENRVKLPIPTFCAFYHALKDVHSSHAERAKDLYDLVKEAQRQAQF